MHAEHCSTVGGGVTGPIAGSSATSMARLGATFRAPRPQGHHRHFKGISPTSISQGVRGHPALVVWHPEPSFDPARGGSDLAVRCHHGAAGVSRSVLLGRARQERTVEGVVDRRERVVRGELPVEDALGEPGEHHHEP